MYKNVVWATDSSEAADRALPHAKALAAESCGVRTTMYPARARWGLKVDP